MIYDFKREEIKHWLKCVTNNESIVTNVGLPIAVNLALLADKMQAKDRGDAKCSTIIKRVLDHSVMSGATEMEIKLIQQNIDASRGDIQ